VGDIYRNGDTYLLGFIKLGVGKLDKTSTTENENIISKISPKQYKQETEPYWKVLQCHKKTFEQSSNTAKALKTTVNDNTTLFDTAITSLQTRETDYKIAREQIMILNESLHPIPINKVATKKDFLMSRTKIVMKWVQLNFQSNI
jgi:hypothetical protein